MNDGASVASLDRIIDERIINSQATPLDRLAADSDVPGLVTEILGHMAEPALVQVAAFNSAI